MHLTRANIVKDNDNAWSYTFEKLPTYLNGKAVIWTASLSEVDRYATREDGPHADYALFRMEQSTGFDFTVHFHDSDNNDAMRPDTLGVEVYGDGKLAGTVTLVPSGTPGVYTASIKELPVWRVSGSDTAVQYTFRWTSGTNKDLENGFYSASATKNGSAVETGTFYYLSTQNWGDKDDAGLNSLTGQYQWETTLTHDLKVRDVSTSLMWDDDANRDGYRPESVTVELYANGEPTGKTAVLSEDNGWAYTWKDVAALEQGEGVIYTVDLPQTPDHYTKTITNGTDITLTHEPDLLDVVGAIHWDDSTEIRSVLNSKGELVREYNQIDRVPVTMELMADGKPTGLTAQISAETYGSGEYLSPTAINRWSGLNKYRDGGEQIEYTIRVYSDELDALLADGYSLTYGSDGLYLPSVTVTHDLYDVRGTVYYLYDYDDSFLLAGVPVTAYIYNEEAKTYSSVGSTVTDEDGTFELLNLPQGLLTIRATYQYNGTVYAGSSGVQLDRRDAQTTIVANRDAAGDGDLYRYSAVGSAFYQTDRTDNTTITPVPEGSIALLYTVDANGEVEFTGLTSGVAYYPVLVYSKDYRVIDRDVISFKLSVLDGQELDDTCTNTTGEAAYDASMKTAEVKNVGEDGTVTFSLKQSKDTIVFHANPGDATTAPELSYGGLTNSSTVSKTLEASAVKYGDLASASLTGYDFLGCFTEAEGGEQITSDTMVNVSTVVISNAPDCDYEKTLPLYAHFQPHTYTLKFNPGESKTGVKGTVSPATKEITFGEIIGTLPTPVLEGYVFGGWMLKNADSTIATISADDAWTRPYTNGATIELYASWTPKSYTYNFSLNDNTGSTRANLVGTDIDYVDIIFDSPYGDQFEVVAQRSGYKFLGWSLNASGPVLGADDLNQTTKNATLYAIWEPLEYIVRLEMNGGTIANLPGAVYDADTDTWTMKVKFDTVYGELPIPSKADCTYRGYLATAPGWPADAGYGITVNGEILTSLPQYIDHVDAGGITLSAVLEPWFTFSPAPGTFPGRTLLSGT